MNRIQFFDAPITTKNIPKKKLIDNFVKSWNCDHNECSSIEQFYSSHKPTDTHNIVMTGEMYGIITPSTYQFYGSLADLIGVVFLIDVTPSYCNYTCIGTPDNILAFRYLFRQARKQQHEDWKKYDKSVLSYSLWTWDDDYTEFIADKCTKLIENTKRLHTQYTSLVPPIRRWYREHLKNTHK